MNKKSIIQVSVIIAAFGASGIVLYNGLFKKPAPPPSVKMTASMTMPVGGSTPDTQSAQGTKAVLPIPGQMDLEKKFKLLSQNGLIFGFSYPKIDKQTEVGLPLQELLRPLPSPEEEQQE